ncbi:MAG: acetyl-CoA hydrolase/transferase C-terminal domain-containing protein [Solirubrobacterales bacterium]
MRTSPRAPGSSWRTAPCSTSATVEIGGRLRSTRSSYFDRGAVITTPRLQVDVIVTEYGAAELEGKTVHQRGLALAQDLPPGLPPRHGGGGGTRLPRRGPFP